jgi:hypothetical protein
MEDDDDVPFADPIIRSNYEAVLGRFILAYNEVDFRVSTLIGAEFEKRRHSDIGKMMNKGSFLQRIDVLQILATSAPALKDLPFARMRAINSDRNTLAHGHFDQNPFDGSYSLVSKAKWIDYPAERVGELADELVAIAEGLRMTEVWYDFDDLDASVNPAS